MVRQHVILVMLWGGFSVLHSLLAAGWMKKRIEVLIKSTYKYYRISYSFLAVFTLGAVLWYHFSIKSTMLWNAPLAEKIIAMAGMITGISVMLLFTRRFFFDLSGADIFRKKQTSQQLITTDFYRYVRHPLYAATLFFVWSIFLWQPLLSNLISCVCISLYTVIGIRYEEKKLIQEFGESYLQYRSKTSMLIPGLF